MTEPSENPKNTGEGAEQDSPSDSEEAVSADEKARLLEQAELEELLAQVSSQTDSSAASDQEPGSADAQALDENLLQDEKRDLLEQRDLDAPLGESDAVLDKPIREYAPVEVEEEALAKAAVLTQAELDQLLTATEEEKPTDSPSDLAQAAAAEVSAPSDAARAPEPSPEKTDAESSAVPRPPLESPGEVQEISVENLASASPEDDALLSKDLLDTLLEEAKSTPEAKVPETPAPTPPEPTPERPAPAPPEAEQKMPAKETPPRPRRKYRFRRPLLPRGTAKTAASLATGLLVAVATFYFLYTHQEQHPAIERLQALAQDDLLNAIENARHAIESGDYASAITQLDRSIPRASPEHPMLPEAEFLRLSAKCLAVPAAATATEVERLQSEIDRVTTRYPGHARVGEALRWKAQLYVRADMPDAAHSVYKRLLGEFANVPDEEAVLDEAARLAKQMQNNAEAAQLAQRLLDRYPASRFAAGARLILADALTAEGRREPARRIYQQLAQTQAHTPAGAQAIARLARLELEAGRYDEAIRQLQARLETATTIEGNDEIYILLAQAYRQMGKLDQAEQVLRDLIAFFPDTPQIPGAYVELAEILEQGGKRREALRLVTQAAQRYPTQPEVMRSLGRFLALSGDVLGAADALAAADAAGARDPDLLLEAARYYRRGGDAKRALDVYERLTLYYPATPQAFQGRIETAKAFQEQGKYRKAFNLLRDLAALTENKPQHLPVLAGLAELYDEMGFRTYAVGAYTQMAGLSAEPALLAQAATALFRNEAWDEGLAVAARVDPARLPDAAACRFLHEYGKALMRSDPMRAIEVLERAYDLYPNERAPEDALTLLELYIVTDRAARARFMVTELEAMARAEPARAPLFQRAALAWGDYLYDRRDFQAAADAYVMAPVLSDDSDPEAQWAKFQRAGAFLHLGDYAACLPIFDEIAASKSPWAAHARLKAAYARLEQTLRGRVPIVMASVGE